MSVKFKAYLRVKLWNKFDTCGMNLLSAARRVGSSSGRTAIMAGTHGVGNLVQCAHNFLNFDKPGSDTNVCRTKHGNEGKEDSYYRDFWGSYYKDAPQWGSSLVPGFGIYERDFCSESQCAQL
jgi:hypothetical protein